MNIAIYALPKALSIAQRDAAVTGIKERDERLVSTLVFVVFFASVRSLWSPILLLLHSHLDQQHAFFGAQTLPVGMRHLPRD